MRIGAKFTLAALACLGFVCARADAGEARIGDKNFTLPDGFTIELVAGPPLVDRPIVADFDEQGRLYVADSSGSSDKVEKQLADKPHRILRLEDTDGDGVFDKRTIFADHMMFQEGAMWHRGSLYVAAPPSIWALRDTDGDGVADEQTEWFNGKTLTGCANDLHGPYLGLDGLIYWCKGAFAEQTYDRAQAMSWTTRAAHIIRRLPDDETYEAVMTGGMDNPVEVVFTPGGERIFSCTFLQHPAAGRRDGLIHAVYGGVYGKVHDVIDSHVRTSPEVMPVLSHLGPAAPCGLVRYESQVFGEGFQDNLFATLFNLHKVTRHVLEPAGATFKSADTDFLTCDNFDFHPTDVLEDADGSLLVLNTGGWYKLCCPTSQLHKPDVLGAIYRIRRSSAAAPTDPRGLKLSWQGATAEMLAQRLADDRPAVRKRAMDQLPLLGTGAVPALEAIAKDSQAPARQRLAAVWTSARLTQAAARAVARTALQDADPLVRQAAAHVVAIYRDKQAGNLLVERLKDESPHVRRAAAEALGRTCADNRIPAILEALAQPNDVVLDHSLTYALYDSHKPEELVNALSDENPRVRRAVMMSLEHMNKGQWLPSKVVIAALSSTDDRLRASAVWIAARHPDWGDDIAGDLKSRLAQSPASSDVLSEQLTSLSSLPQVADLLTTTAADTNGAASSRKLALRALARGPRLAASENWIKAMTIDVAERDTELASLAIAAIRQSANEKEIAAPLAQALRVASARADLPAATRLEGMSVFPARSLVLDSDAYAFVTSQLSETTPAASRLLAADVLGRAKLSPAQLGALAASISAAGPLEIDRLLAAYAGCSDKDLGLKLVETLRTARARSAIRPETIERDFAGFGPTVLESLTRVLAEIYPDTTAQRQRLETLLRELSDGDIRRGQAVFNSAKAACATCHTIGYVGGNVGPDLSAVGKVRTRRDLLESIVYPSASFVQSYQPMMVQTRKGETLSGVMKRNDADAVVLVTGPQQEVRIARADVKDMKPSNISVMPAGLDQQLSPQELGDLVAFLQSRN